MLKAVMTLVTIGLVTFKSGQVYGSSNYDWNAETLLKTEGSNCGKYADGFFVPEAVREIENLNWNYPARAIGVFESNVCGLDNWHDAVEAVRMAKKPKKTWEYMLVTFVCEPYYVLRQFQKAESCLNYYEAFYLPGFSAAKIRDKESIRSNYDSLDASIQYSLGNYEAALEAALRVEDRLTRTMKSPVNMDNHRAERLFFRGYVDGAIAAHILGKTDVALRILASLADFRSDAVNGKDPTYQGKLKAEIARGYIALGDAESASAVMNTIGPDIWSVSSRTLAFIVSMGTSEAVGLGEELTAGFSQERLYLTARLCVLKKEFACARDGYQRLLSGDFGNAASERLAVTISSRPDLYYIVNHDLAMLLKAAGEKEAAIKHLKSAVEALESQRASITRESARMGFLNDKQSTYFELVKLLIESGDVADAFVYVERAKGRALVDLLAHREDLGVSPKQRELIKSVTKKWPSAGVENQSVSTRGIQLSADAQKTIRENYPELNSLMSVEFLSAREVQGLIGQGEVLVEYYGSEDQLFAFLLTPESIEVFQLDGHGLTDLVDEYRDMLEEGDTDWLQLSEALYQKLILPIAKNVQDLNLIVVPHGPLHYLPFGSLVHSGGYFSDQHALRLLPSASVLEFLDDVDPDVQSPILVLGNPTLDLPGAEIEARRIAENWGESKVLLREQAREVELKREGKQFSYLHIASHGEFNADNALDSRLLLAEGQGEDGSLTVAELYSLPLNAELVTLSACETGLGNIESGDELIGLTRGFLFAGTDSIVASLWKVDDSATQFFMEAFYAALKTNSKSQALQIAQQSTREEFEHPYYWSAFQLTGSD